MKKNLHIALIATFLFLSHCEKKEIIDSKPEENALEISVHYKTNKKEYPDVGSKLYIYKNIEQIDAINYELDTNGVLFNSYKPNEKIHPDSIATIGISGFYRYDIEPFLNKFFIIIESNHAFVNDRKMISTFTDVNLQRRKRMRKHSAVFVKD